MSDASPIRAATMQHSQILITLICFTKKHQVQRVDVIVGDIDSHAQAGASPGFLCLRKISKALFALQADELM